MGNQSEDVRCRSCGATPAVHVTIRRHVGMVLMQRFHKLQAPLCRNCGLRVLRQYTGRTLVQGWWGYISFFVNLFVLAANANAALRLLRLPPVEVPNEPPQPLP